MAVRSPTRVRDPEGMSPLFEACKTGDTAAVKQLATPENVNSRDMTGRKSTPLHFAAGKALTAFSLYDIFVSLSLSDCLVYYVAGQGRLYSQSVSGCTDSIGAI